MAISDLFKSKKEREKDANKKRRKAFRDAENAVGTVKDRIRGLKNERDKSWQQARQYLKDGQKGASQRCLQSVRGNEVMMEQLEKKRWVFEQLLTKLEMAKTDLEFSGALQAINTVVEIDPDAIADVLDDVQDKLGDQVDVDKIWDNMYGKEMNGIEGHESDVIPSLDDMMKNLEDEVVADVRGDKIVGKEKTTKSGGSKISDEISKGRSKLKTLMDNDK